MNVQSHGVAVSRGRRCRCDREYCEVENWLDRLWVKWWAFSKKHYFARRINTTLNEWTTGWWSYQGHCRRNLPTYLREACR